MPETPFVHLASEGISLLLEPVADGVPILRHFGARLGECDDIWPAAGMRPPPPTLLDGDPPLSVLSTHGFGWFNQPAIAGSRPGNEGDLDWALNFKQDSIDRSGHALLITLSDELARLRVKLGYALESGSDVVSTWAEVENFGDTEFRLDWLAAACIPLPPRTDQVLGFSGRWTLEFHEAREPLGIGTWRRDNRRGRTSHDSFPGVMTGTTLADDTGGVFGAHLGWSGNHTILIEPLSDGRRQLQMGEWLAPGEVVLRAGERYRTPTAHLSFSLCGLNGLSANFHHFVRQHVLSWPGNQMAPRPVHLNTWEAVYCNHDLVGLKALASVGAEVGVERFVLDDGWFHGRSSDRAGLGDWQPDTHKYPHGLTPLVDHVRALGMQFGLWVEPEMVNPDSNLHRAHPEWVLRLEGRPVVTGRNQLVLDLANGQVFECVFDQLDGLLREYPISYLKWDMNRDLAAAGHDGRAAYRLQTNALYRLLARLRAAHPEVEIESCASGGGRADYGVLSHMHRVWTSDCNDALTRIDIQRGFLRFFPPEVMGAHIGPALSHTTGRQHMLAFRAAAALFGHLGLEMDVRLLDVTERTELAYWISVYKEWRNVVHGGTLRQGGSEGPCAWLQVTAKDLGSALIAVYRRNEERARYMQPLTVNGLDPERRYRLQAISVPVAPHFTQQTDLLRDLIEGNVVLSGATLRGVGLPLPPMPPESAVVISCRAV
ncbi:alpha-galactosidase [Burkholderia sp. NLJ2]|uniref:alpha-galactosidase n=1 Tax=Burkholderia sp. NLJ2 TaxID=3090699 RepID=UPI003C6C7836